MELISYFFFSNGEWINNRFIQLNSQTKTELNSFNTYKPDEINDTKAYYIGIIHNDFKFRLFSYDVKDWCILFDDLIESDKIADKYYYQYLFKLLYKLDEQKFSSKNFAISITKTINKYPNFKEWLIGTIWSFSTYISYNKRALIIEVLNFSRNNYKNHRISFIYEAYNEVQKSPNSSIDKIGVFGLIGGIEYWINKFKKENKYNKLESLSNSNNDILNIILWISNSAALKNTSILDKYFYYFTFRNRVKIVKKLFYEHRIGNIILKVDFLESLANSKKRIIENFQTSLEFKPRENLYLDILVTSLKHFQGNSSYTKNIILDLVILKSTKVLPSISLNTPLIFDTCNGGLMLNNSFSGFIIVTEDKDNKYFKLNNAIYESEKWINKQKTEEYLKDALNKNAIINKSISNCWYLPKEDTKKINRLLKLLLTNDNSQISIDTNNSVKLKNTFLINFASINSKRKDWGDLDIIRHNELCYPKKSKTNLRIVDREFLWCDRSMCFNSSIVYKETTKWIEYKLLDFLKIFKINEIEVTSCGLVPNDKYIRLVDLSKKAQKIIEHLKCHSCGHLLYPSKRVTGNYVNEYNYYSCKNTKCNNEESIYINHCFSCSKGVIDSRLSKTCPNGLRICPECLSCCSNNFFKNVFEKRVIANTGEIKTQTFTHGHLEQNKFFCPKCGEEVIKKNKKCSNCGMEWQKKK